MRLNALIVAALAALTLAACGKKEEAVEAPAHEATPHGEADTSILTLEEAAAEAAAAAGGQDIPADAQPAPAPAGETTPPPATTDAPADPAHAPAAPDAHAAPAH